MRLRIPFPLSAAYVCRTVGHVKRISYDPKVGWPVTYQCITCGEEWPFPTVKESLHRGRVEMGQDCTTLGRCSTDGHTNEWPCDYA